MKDTKLVRLYILSKMLDAPTNPYRIFKEYQSSYAVRFQPIEEAKFYYNIDLLHKRGYILQTSVVPGDNAPNKKMYAITQSGHSFFENALYESFATANSVDDLYLTFPFFDLIDKERAQNMLGVRVSELERELDVITENADETFLAEYAIQKRQFHLMYLKKILERMGQMKAK